MKRYISKIVIAFSLGLFTAYCSDCYDCCTKDDKRDVCKPKRSDQYDDKPTCFRAYKLTTMLFKGKCFATREKAWDAIYRAYPSVDNYDHFDVTGIGE